MDLLCDRVGATGEVVGVDSESRMIAMARDVAAELNLTNLALVEAEAAGTGHPAVQHEAVRVGPLAARCRFG